MKLSAALLAASLGVAAAHGDHGQHVPKLVGGRRFLSDMKMRQAATPHQPIVDRKSRRSTKPPGSLQERQLGGISGQCGPGYGSCAQGYCCSPEGSALPFLEFRRCRGQRANIVCRWCGKGLDYCSAPDCQLNYGTGCDGVRMRNTQIPPASLLTFPQEQKAYRYRYFHRPSAEARKGTLRWCWNIRLCQRRRYRCHLRRWAVHLYQRSPRQTKGLDNVYLWQCLRDV